MATSIPVFMLSPQEFKELLEFEPKFATIMIKRIVSHPLQLSDGESIESIGGEEEGLECEAKGLEMDQRRAVKVIYLLQIQGFDLWGDHRVEMEKVATLPFHQDQSNLQNNSLQVKQAVFDDGEIINTDVMNPNADLPVLYYFKPDQDQDIINALALKAAKCGVPALIAARDPGMPHNIPVFVFSVKGKSPDCSYGHDNATFACPTTRSTYADVSSRREQDVEVSNSSAGHKESRVFFGSVVKGFNNLVFTPEVKSKGVLQKWLEDAEGEDTRMRDQAKNKVKYCSFIMEIVVVTIMRHQTRTTTWLIP